MIDQRFYFNVLIFSKGVLSEACVEYYNYSIQPISTDSHTFLLTIPRGLELPAELYMRCIDQPSSHLTGGFREERRKMPPLQDENQLHRAMH
jgi:hypothetical protein